MDVVNHAAQSFIISYLATRSWILTAIGVLIGIVPDVAGQIKQWISKDNYRLYDTLHQNYIELAILIVLAVIATLLFPSSILTLFGMYGLIYLLHTLEDTYTHGVGKRWYAGKWYEYFMPWRYRERMWTVPVAWLVVLLFIYFLFIK